MEVTFANTQFDWLTYAQWAHLFEDFTIEWKYRTVSFPITCETSFTPDFWLPDLDAFFHIGIDSASVRQWSAFAKWLRLPDSAQHVPVDARPFLALGTFPSADDTEYPKFEHKGACDLLYSTSKCCNKWFYCVECERPDIGHYQSLICSACEAVQNVGATGESMGDNPLRIAFTRARRACEATYSSVCKKCDETILPRHLVNVGKPIGSQKWFHAECLLQERRRKYSLL